MRFTFEEVGGEPAFVDGSVRHECDHHLIPSGLDVIRNEVATVAADERRSVFVPITNLYVVIDACLVSFDLRKLKLKDI